MRHAASYSLGWLLGAALGLVVGCSIAPDVLSPDSPQSASPGATPSVVQGDNGIARLHTDVSVIQNDVGLMRTYAWIIMVGIVGVVIIDAVFDAIMIRAVRRNGNGHGKT